jgi:hypothetical protein
MAPLAESVKQRTDYLSVEGIIDARTIIEGTITVETLPALSTMAGQIISTDADRIGHVGGDSDDLGRRDDLGQPAAVP